LRNELVKTAPKKKEKKWVQKKALDKWDWQNTQEEGKKMVIWSLGLNWALVRNLTWNSPKSRSSWPTKKHFFKIVYFFIVNMEPWAFLFCLYFVVWVVGVSIWAAIQCLIVEFCSSH
jgi:hypothetical protein